MRPARLCHPSLIAATVLLLLGSPALAQPAQRLPRPLARPVTKLPPVVRVVHAASPEDLKMIQENLAQAAPLTNEERSGLRRSALPPSVDYTPFLAFIRNQDGWGGCGTMASLTVLDIVKSRECQYAPSSSYRFAEYVYNNEHLGQLDVLQQRGCCPEALLPSNNDPPGPAVPSPANYQQALNYRLASYSGPKSKFSVNDLKGLLYHHGPLWVIGDLPGMDPWSHCFAVVGYNDNDPLGGAFTVANSWGTGWQSRGLGRMPYTSVTTLEPDNARSFPRLKVVRYVNDTTTGDLGDHYVGHIKLSHTQARNLLTISVGVEGEAPMVVWDQPNRTQCVDDSRELSYNFPLPAYAGSHWPPSASNRWYVRVVDHSGGPRGSIGQISRVLLAYRPARQQPVVLYAGQSANYTIPAASGVDVFIPSRTTYTLSLAASAASVPAGTPVTLSGLLATRVQTASNLFLPAGSPVAGESVSLYRTQNDPLEGTTLREKVGTAVTTATGRYTLTHAPQLQTVYQAIASRADGTVLATSPLVTVKIQ